MAIRVEEPKHGVTKIKEGMTMKKMNILSMAALLMAGAAFTACSSDDNNIIEEQPVNPTGQYTMTIQASKGSDAALTRALSPNGSTLNATWADGEEVLVYQGDTQIGTLTSAASNDASTTLSGTLTSAPNASTALTFYFHTKDAPNYATGQDGTLATIASSYDYCLPATVAAGGFTVENNTVTVTSNSGSISFGANQQAIAKFTLVDKANTTTKLSPTSLSLSFDFDAATVAALKYAGIYSTVLAQLPTYNLTPASDAYTTNGDGVLYLAIPDAADKLATLNGIIASASGSTTLTTNNLTFTITATVGTDTYFYIKSGFPFENGNYYDITVKMKKDALSVTDASSGNAVTKGSNGIYSLTNGHTYDVSGVGIGSIDGIENTLNIAASTQIVGVVYIENVSNINLAGDATITGNLSNNASSSGVCYNISGSGTLTVDGLLSANVYLAAGVTLRVKAFGSVHMVKDATGTANITPTSENGYYVYAASAAPTITVGIPNYYSGDKNFKVQFYGDTYNGNNDSYNTVGEPVDLTVDVETWQHWGNSYTVYTATAPATAKKYRLKDGDNFIMDQYADISGGPIYYSNSDSWGYTSSWN